MKINKLLERQLKKHFPNGFGGDPALVRLVEAVNNSYNSYERDSELTSHFFRLSEKEYIDLTNKLSDELDLKEQSILELKLVVGDVSGEQLETSDNSLPGIIAFLKEEVNKRQIAEKERSSLSQRLSALILNMQDGLLVEDESRNIIIANQVFCDMFGIPVPPETLTGADCTGSAESSKHLFENSEEFVERISVLVAERKPVVQEELELKDGRYFSRDFIPIYEGDEYLGHFWKYKDKTQEKVNMRKLEKSELKTRLIMNGSPDAIITINFNGRITHWNQHAEQLFGWSENEVLNELLASRIIPLEFRRKHLKNLIQHRQTGTGFMLNRKLEATALHRDGHEFPVEVLVVPLMQDGAEFFCYYIRDISERLRTERELRLISLVASLNKNGVIFTDTNGRINWVNDGFLGLTGYNRNEIMGRTPIELLRGDLTDKEAMKDLLSKFYQSENFIEEINCYRKDSTFFWARISGQYISGEKDGRPKYFAVIEDITREKETQEKLMEFNNRFREALDKIGDNVWEHDFTTNTTRFTSSSEQVLGVNVGVVSEKSSDWWSHVHPEDRPLLEQYSKGYRRNVIDHHTLEYRIIGEDGTVKWVLDRGVVIERNADGTPDIVVGTHTDITERKLYEKNLEFNEQKYRSIIANMNLGLLEVDTDEFIRFANHSFCEMSGYDVDELIGRKASDLFTRGGSKTNIEDKNSLRQQGVSDAYELPVRNKRGELKWWLISGAPRYSEHGDYSGSIGIHLDITKQKKLEMELYEAREAAEDSARSKEIFLANMSHEIRTPMNAILGMSRQLQKSELNTQQRFFLNTINTAGENLLVILNDILDISKIEAGMLQLETIPFSTGSVMKHIIQVMQHRADEKGLLLKYDADPAICPVLKGDPYRLNQVLLNLLSNAIKFTEKGIVEVSCKLIRDEETRQVIGITVRDTGIGMDEEFRKQLFQNFSQEDKTTARKFGGTGLGMSISKQLIELMGGTIAVNSSKGEGTEVILTVVFPVGSNEDLGWDVKEVADKTRLRDKKILLVEDNEMNRLVATTILQQYGAHISEVENGQEAVAALQQSVYDIVLMDMQMPVMDGLEATRIIRKNISREIPVIALTANAIKGESDRCIAAGMNDYISKPFEEEDLINCISKWLGRTNITPGKEEEKTNEPVLLFSLDKLKKISNNNNEFIERMIGLFIDQVPQSVSEIRKAFEDKDFARVKSVTHRIKPTIDNMGIQSLYQVVRDIEFLTVNETESKKLPALIGFFESRIKEVVIQLNQRHPVA